ncbi:hypothetical protein [Exiguobacterium flavidum]|uniref:hypothetical protein n=1 Tax=Exiguobacterium flavidum TaxID=2184695 RepID=UPI000DF73857|nr:hypothetical protein [Exiguobacterium flavidum]
MPLLYFMYESISVPSIQQYLFSGWMLLVLLTVSFSLAHAHPNTRVTQRFGLELLVPGSGNLMNRSFLPGFTTIVSLIIVRFIYMFEMLSLQSTLMATFVVSVISLAYSLFKKHEKAEQ